MEYMIVIQLTDAGDYLAYLPELPGCAARGDTVQEADDNLRTALHNHLVLLRAQAQAQAEAEAQLAQLVGAGNEREFGHSI